MKRLLVIAHAPSPNIKRMIDAVLKGANSDDIDGVETVYIPALEAVAEDVFKADALILGTPENLGYMSGALKDFFDRIYYPCLDECQGLPISLIVRAGHDGTGTVRAITTIINGLKWSWAQQPLICKGPWRPDFLNEAALLAARRNAARVAGLRVTSR